MDLCVVPGQTEFALENHHSVERDILAVNVHKPVEVFGQNASLISGGDVLDHGSEINQSGLAFPATTVIDIQHNILPEQNHTTDPQTSLVHQVCVTNAANHSGDTSESSGCLGTDSSPEQIVTKNVTFLDALAPTIPFDSTDGFSYSEMYEGYYPEDRVLVLRELRENSKIVSNFLLGTATLFAADKCNSGCDHIDAKNFKLVWDDKNYIELLSFSDLTGLVDMIR
jgi:hypothetical protein